MSRITTLLSVTAIAALAAMPALAKPPHPPHPTHPTHPQHPTKGYRAAPGPEAGIGLPILAAVGGYLIYVRRRRRRAGRPQA